MTKRIPLLLALLTLNGFSGCAAAVGAGAAVVIDEVLEDRNGDDGLF